MTDWTPPPSFLRVFDARGGVVRLMVSEESKLDAAVERHLETGRDSLLHLEFVEGGEYITLASEITSWFITTPELRDHAERIDAMLKAEQQAGGWVDPE